MTFAPDYSTPDPDQARHEHEALLRVRALIEEGGPLWSVYDKRWDYARNHILEALDGAL